MEIGLQDALQHFNVGKGAWYGWKDTKDGEVYSNIKLLDETATMPTEEEINAKIVELQWEQNRKNDYPSIPDQLDDIFHNGIDGWKATIQETKDKYPKG
jgi:hypothetical protein